MFFVERGGVMDGLDGNLLLNKNLAEELPKVTRAPSMLRFYFVYKYRFR